MRGSGFYKVGDNELFYAPNFVSGPGGFELRKENKDTYNYPMNGWIWAENETQARTTLNFNDGIEVLNNWQQFIESVPPSVLQKVALNPLGALIITRLTRIADSGIQFDGVNDVLVTTWNAAGLSLTSAEILQMNNLATAKTLPIRMNDAGHLIIP
jgi:hypothetical protein